MVPRFNRIRYRGCDAQGVAFEREADGFHARVVQHECDHLDGVLLFDRMERDERKRALKQWREQGSGGRSRRSAL